jgi:hypothetical protein
MTDIIKFLEEVASKNEKNLNTFREEMQDLKARAPTILAFGKPVGLITEIPLSPALERAFAAAKKIQVRFTMLI